MRETMVKLSKFALLFGTKWSTMDPTNVRTRPFSPTHCFCIFPKFCRSFPPWSPFPNGYNAFLGPEVQVRRSQSCVGEGPNQRNTLHIEKCSVMEILLDSPRPPCASFCFCLHHSAFVPDSCRHPSRRPACLAKSHVLILFIRGVTTCLARDRKSLSHRFSCATQALARLVFSFLKTVSAAWCRKGDLSVSSANCWQSEPPPSSIPDNSTSTPTPSPKRRSSPPCTHTAF